MGIAPHSCDRKKRGYPHISLHGRKAFGALAGKCTIIIKRTPMRMHRGSFLDDSMPPFEAKNQIAIWIFQAPAAPSGQSQLCLSAPFFFSSGFFSVISSVLVHDQLLAQPYSKFNSRRGQFEKHIKSIG
jgi:hypothetical protein